mgnify:FL=1
MKNKITVFSLSSSKKLAQDIASILGTKVGDCKVHHFADGEILCEIGESVRGKDVFIVQSTSNPVTENLMEILVLTDALKRASAREITAVIPYFGYARQDRKAKPRQPITSKLVADLLTTAGVNRVVTVDLHAAQIQGFFDIPVDEMQALPLLINTSVKRRFEIYVLYLLTTEELLELVRCLKHLIVLSLSSIREDLNQTLLKLWVSSVMLKVRTVS